MARAALLRVAGSPRPPARQARLEALELQTLSMEEGGRRAHEAVAGMAAEVARRAREGEQKAQAADEVILGSLQRYSQRVQEQRQS